MTVTVRLRMQFLSISDWWRNRIEVVYQNLINDIKNRNYALTSGDIGYRYLLRVLEENGDSDIIYKMNTKYDVPGYGWQLAYGATALTESGRRMVLYRIITVCLGI